MLKKVDARKIYFSPTLLKMSTRDPHHQLGIPVVSLIKLLMTANIFETGFLGIFSMHAEVFPARKSLISDIPIFPDVDGDHSLTFVTV
jgi:hypothetical protein